MGLCRSQCELAAQPAVAPKPPDTLSWALESSQEA